MKLFHIIHKCLAILLLTALLLLNLTAGGMAQVLANHHDDRQTVTVQPAQLSDVEDDGVPLPDFDIPPLDFPPPANEWGRIPPYAPEVSMLTHHEPFRALPQVVADRFIPPQLIS